MRRIPTRHLRKNSILALDIYDSDGRLLIKKGTKIDNKLIEGLKKFDILYVYIIDEYTNEVIDDIVGSELRLKATMELKRMAAEFYNIELKKRFNTIQNDYIINITSIARDIVDELIKKDEVLIDQIDIRSLVNYNYSHSVNVAIISIILGIELKYDRDVLIKIAVSAMLHDVGKALLPRELLLKTTEKSLEEELLKQHCILGYNYLSKYSNVDEKIKLVVIQHHEKIDGTGYPKKLKGNQIDEFSKIISIANFYDNLMAKMYVLNDNLPNDALEQIMSYVGSAFDFKLVNILFKKVKPFLNGTIVKLNNGDIAIVEGTIKGFPLRPIVRILKSSDEKRKNKYINLVDKLDIAILEVVYYI